MDATAPTLYLHNSLTGSRQPLTPRTPGHVGLYVCGVTVYDYCHIGHARAMIVFDALTRFLQACGLSVRYVRNVTDIDDKIIARASESGESAEAIATYFTAAMRADEAALGLGSPDVEPAATGFLAEIIALIERLIETGNAYVGDNGDVYYDVSQFEAYGQLSGRDPAELRAGARVEVNESKADPLDFTLWKAAKAGEPAWASPWGEGRPGWHIECSAMSTSCLGTQFDIHGGGLDLKFPHHENEIAQSEGAFGPGYAGIWMHNGFVTVDDEKMSKSLGNFWTIRDVLAEFDAETIRYFVLATHYRSPLAYSREALSAASEALGRLYTALRDAPSGGDDNSNNAMSFVSAFDRALADDFNTPAALSVCFELARACNRAGADAETGNAADYAAALAACGARIGLLQHPPTAFFQDERHIGADGPSAAEVESKLADREAARAARDFQTADAIRDELAAAGIAIEDSADGPRWRRR
ncbi:cysteine--tRNA ligase [Salinisphaera sp. USBA-960]|nr:cysteine--tRNA ligase [Salifodinibacter halophilus]NNC25331.1 cysteine--tRNA ligase [Salifodinibacter halophilus]